MSSRPEIVESVIRLIRLTARNGIAIDAKMNESEYDKYLRECNWFHGFSGTKLLFCRHDMGDGHLAVCLSVSFCRRLPMASDQLARVATLKQAGVTLRIAPFNKALARDWARALFGNDHPKLVIGEPHTEIGRRMQVMHFHLNCDADWKAARVSNMDKGWRFWAEVFGIAA